MFQTHFLDNIITLHNDLAHQQYQHGGYHGFNISDPKPRNIHKALVRDRLLYHAIHRKLYPFFDCLFIADSFSCRVSKGTHKALDRFTVLSRKVSKNGTKTCWVLKCDIKKFFATIDHNILLKIMTLFIPDQKLRWLLGRIIESFHTHPNKGLPLGNLTSQLFVNIYMNEFDQFVKHKLKARYYIRYADDFVCISRNKAELEEMLCHIANFLYHKLQLNLHPHKVSIKTLASGVDFLGWVHFPTHRVLRTTTRKRMMKKLSQGPSGKAVQSYLGLLQHGNTHKLQQEVVKNVGINFHL